MNLDIGNKSYDVVINVKAVRELDKRHSIEEQGLKFSAGVSLSYMLLEMGNLDELTQVLRIVLEGNHTQKAVDRAVEEYADEHGGLEGLFEGLKEELGKSPLTKETVSGFSERYEQALAEEE